MICLDTLPPLIASCDTFKNFLSKKIALYKLAFETGTHCKTSLEENSLWWTKKLSGTNFYGLLFFIKLFSLELNRI